MRAQWRWISAHGFGAVAGAEGGNAMLRRTLPLCVLLAGPGCYSGLAGSGGATDGDDAGGPGGNTAPTEASATEADEGSGESGDDETGDEEEGELDPGRVTLHRLNRAEYNNTVRDLFYGLDLGPADQFPADDHSFGFDNIADSLNMTPLLFELYERAADQTLEAAFAAPNPESVRHEAEIAGGTVGSECCGGYWNLNSNGTITFAVDASAEGEYEFLVLAAGQQAGPDLPNMIVSVDGVEAGNFDVTGTAEAPEELTFSLDLTAGAHSVVVEFTNDFFEDGVGDRNLLVDYVDIDGPLGGPEGGVFEQLVTCTTAEDPDCTDATIRRFAERAWRRPVTEDELAALVEFVAYAEGEGETWENGLKLAMKAAMLSSNFIFRVELDPEPTSAEPHPLGDYEVASRLSYFLWSSMPDDALFEAASDGMLTDRDEVATQVQRMLTDERAQALAANFGGQWLYSRALDDELVKDPGTYPEFDPELRDAMRAEMELNIEAFIKGDRGLDELLTSKDTFVNDRLAEFYGIPAVGTDEMVPVRLENTPRKGLLTSAGLMTVLSHPNVTSPIKRGKWVVEQLLCIEPPPPPAGVETTVDPSFGEGPMRERLAKHREDPSCAACHELMDPVGLAFENYDGVGAWRDQEGPWDIDASGMLPIGGEFNDALEMVELIAASEAFAKCTTEKALLYGLGREVTNEDEEIVIAASEALIESDYAFEALIIALTTSDAFLMRRGEPTE